MTQALLVVRHGNYDEKLNLDEEGKNQMRNLARFIKVVSANKSLRPRIICSSAPRAKEGGKIIAEILTMKNSDISYRDCLWDDDTNPGDFEKSIELVDNSSGEGILLIVLTHMYFVPMIARDYGKKKGLNISQISSPGYGKGFLLYGEETVTKVPFDA